MQDWSICKTWTCIAKKKDLHQREPCIENKFIPSSLALFHPQVRRIRAATPSFTRSSASLREHKASMTLATVLGVFIVCWLPYIIFFTCMGLRRETEPPRLTHSVVLWLGYFNSALNPILYPALNRDFRRAYRHLLLCRNPRRNTCTSIGSSCWSVISNEIANEYSKLSVDSQCNQNDMNDYANPEHTS